jgi:hypothetical protein
MSGNPDLMQRASIWNQKFKQDISNAIGDQSMNSINNQIKSAITQMTGNGNFMSSTTKAWRDLFK